MVNELLDDIFIVICSYFNDEFIEKINSYILIYYRTRS